MTDDQKLRVEEIKRQLKSADDEWERLDSQGTQVERQQKIANSMERLRDELKQLSGEDSDV